jgi:hypothetical protein
MKHFAAPSFWDCYNTLPLHVQQLADKNFDLLKHNTHHSSLHLKRINDYWSVRVGVGYRALGVSSESGDAVWFWIGTHREYERLIK